MNIFSKFARMIFPSDEYDKSEKSSSFVVEKVPDRKSTVQPEIEFRSVGPDLHPKISESIIVSLPYTVSETDLQFLGFSQIDNRPIYKYVGQDFSKFSHPYEECVSLPPVPPESRTIIE